MVCFKMHRSPLWGAFFMLVNMASCIFISIIPEVFLNQSETQNGTRITG